jgi:Zn-dependent peptidase ImmA (M78 family)
LELLQSARAIFRDAAQRAVVPLASDDIEALAQKLSFSLSVRPSVTSKLGDAISQITLRPSTATAIELATQVRYLLNVGDVDPLFHLPTLLADHLNIFVFPIEQKSIVGGSAILAGGAFIFISSSTNVETLFICAHELAHLATMSARRRDSPRAVLDPADDGSPPVISPYEHFANAFAAELLIPLRGLGVALRKIRRLMGASGDAVGDVELLYLSRIFGVPFLTIAKRCERARLLPKGGAVSLYEFLTNKFGGPEFRAEEIGLPPRPMLKIAPVPRLIELATIDRIRKGEVSVEQASIALSWPITDLAQASR